MKPTCLLRGTKEDENPPLPVAMLRSNGNPAPLEKGDIGGFEWGLSGKKWPLSLFFYLFKCVIIE